MRRIAFILAAVVLFSLGATSSTDCLSSFLPILVPRQTVSIHAVNDAYNSVSVELVSPGTTKTALAVGDAIRAVGTQGGANSPATQPSGTTLDRNQDIKMVSLPCTSITGPIALKATYKNDSGTQISATSPGLYLDNDFSCGDRVDFIIRPAAMVGIVVGYEVVSGGAD